MKKNNKLHFLNFGLWVFIIFIIFVSIFHFTTDNNRPEYNQSLLNNKKGELEIHFIDVGQGDCILIKQGDSHSMIIDAGGNSKGTSVQKYLYDNGVTHLDYVIGTHPHEDHVGGLDVILYKFDVDIIIMPDYKLDTKTCDDVYNVINEKRYKVDNPDFGDTYAFGEASFTIIKDDSYDGDNPNNYSIGILLEYGNTSFLFCGDMEYESELNIVKSGYNLNADVLKANHHGSSTSSSKEFLAAVSPDDIVISCELDNSYGHPHESVLERIRAYGYNLYRTDLQGTIIAYSDGSEIKWNTEPTNNYEHGRYFPEDNLETENIVNDVYKYENEKIYPDEAYILNTNTLKIHNPECESVYNMSENNKKESNDSIEELENNGYSKCKICMY